MGEKSKTRGARTPETLPEILKRATARSLRDFVDRAEQRKTPIPYDTALCLLRGTRGGRPETLRTVAANLEADGRELVEMAKAVEVMAEQKAAGGTRET